MSEENKPTEAIPQIIITDAEKPEENETESTTTTDAQPSDVEETDVVSLSDVEETDVESQSEGLDISSHRQSVALQLMDKKHEWLTEMEERCANLETAFISKIQFVALSNHFQNCLEEDRNGELAILFDKFRTCYAGSQKLHNKLLEVKSQKGLVEAENRCLKVKFSDLESHLDALQAQLGKVRDEMEDREREKLDIQIELNDLKEEIAKSKLSQVEEEPDEPETRDAATEDELRIRQLEEEIRSLKDDLSFSSQREAELSKRIDRTEKASDNLKKELTVVRSDLQREITHRERAELQLTQTSEELDKKRELTSELSREVQELKKELEMSKSKSSSLLKELRESKKKLDVATQTIEKLRRDLDIREDRLKAVVAQKSSLELEIARKQGEIFSLKADIAKGAKQRSELSRQVTLLKERVLEFEARVQGLQEQIVSSQKMVDALEKEHAQEEEEKKELTKQKDAFFQETQKQERIIINLRLEIKASEEKVADTVKELDAAKLEITRLQDGIRRVERAKDKMAADVLELDKSISLQKGEIKGLKIQLDGSEKTIAKMSHEIEVERAKYKQLAVDERFYRKSCAESGRTIEKLKEDMILLNKHILQLKSYNQDLDEQRKKLEVQLKSSSEQLGSVKESLKQETKTVDALSEKIRRKDDEEHSLLKNLANLQQVIVGLNRKVKNLTEDKDVLSGKVGDRDKEIASCKQKIRILERNLAVADQMVAERGEDVKLLKLQLREMYRGRSLMESKVENIHTTRQELVDVQQEFQDQKQKSKRMEVEIQRPINFHRWRILEGTDPDHAQLVAKVHAVQKQLIQMSSKLDDREVKLQEQEQLVQKLREMLGRRSDVAAADEQLADCRRELKSRTDRLKCLTAERNMFDNLVGKYRQETTALRDELRKYKMAEFEEEAKRKKKSVKLR